MDTEDLAAAPTPPLPLVRPPSARAALIALIVAVVLVAGLGYVAITQARDTQIHPIANSCDQAAPAAVVVRPGNGPEILIAANTGLELINADTGSLRWSARTTGTITFGYDAFNTGRPTASRAIVAFVTGGCLVVLDATDGHLRWSRQAMHLDRPLSWQLDGDTIFLQDWMTPPGASAEVSYVAALDANDGTTRWATAIHAGLAATLAPEGDVVLVAEHQITPYSQTAIIRARARLTALDRHTGAVRWYYQSATQPDLILSADAAHAVIEDNFSGTLGLLGFDVATGGPRWQTPGVRGLGLVPQIVGNIVVAAMAGQVVGVDLRDGTVRWRNMSPTQSVYNSAFPLDDTTIVTRQNGLVRTIDVATGTTLWEQSDVGDARIGFGHGIIYISQGAGIAGLNPRDGSVRWTTDQVCCPSLLSWGAMHGYFPSGEQIVAVDNAAGTILWQLPLVLPITNSTPATLTEIP